MPTYDYRCSACAHEESVFQTIGEYRRNPIRPICGVCFPNWEIMPLDNSDFRVEHPHMERKLSVNPAMSGLANALAGDRHYDGLAHTDGTLINSRTKHRQFMKDRGYTLAGDFKNTWAQAQVEREQRRTGQYRDPDIKREVTEQVMRAVAQPD